MFLLEPYEVFFGLRPENSGFIKNAPFVVGLGKVVEDLLDAGCCRLIRRRYRVWFQLGQRNADLDGGGGSRVDGA